MPIILKQCPSGMLDCQDFVGTMDFCEILKNGPIWIMDNLVRADV